MPRAGVGPLYGQNRVTISAARYGSAFELKLTIAEREGRKAIVNLPNVLGM